VPVNEARFGTVEVMMDRAGQYPRGAALTLAELRGDPHPALARLREAEPVSWVPVLNGWLITRWDLAAAVMRDSATFTVDDPRFSTARIVGPSMLSLDGPGHDRHRRPFGAPFSRSAVHDQLAAFVTGEADRLVSAMRTESTGGRPAGQDTGRGDLSRGLAAPLAVAVVARALGLGQVDPGTILAWYDAIVGAVSELAGGASTRSARVAAGTAGFSQLSDSLAAVIEGPADSSLLAAAVQPGLSPAEIISNAAVLMFGGIETTEGMIANAAWHLLSHRDQLDLVRADPGLLPQAIEESLRLEPAAAVVDRYATRDVELGDARLGRATIGSGDLVSVSLAGAGRDPAVFADPDRFDVRRDNARQNLAFARGPHFCLGAHLARLEAQAALSAALSQLPGLRLDPDHGAGDHGAGNHGAGNHGAAAPRGLVFRKPPSLPVRWDAAG
jgi:cytochrome P450